MWPEFLKGYRGHAELPHKKIIPMSSINYRKYTSIPDVPWCSSLVFVMHASWVGAAKICLASSVIFKQTQRVVFTWSRDVPVFLLPGILDQVYLFLVTELVYIYLQNKLSRSGTTTDYRIKKCYAKYHSWCIM